MKVWFYLFVPLVAASTRPKSTPTIASSQISKDGKLVEIAFGDGSVYEFHSMWLRDACRDENHVAKEAGERILTATPVGPLAFCDANLLQAKQADLQESGEKLTIHWNGASKGIPKSKFDSNFLYQYAPIVAKSKKVAATTSSKDPEWNSAERIPTWLEPFTGFPDARSQRDDEINYWGTDFGKEFQRFEHSDVMNNPNSLLKMLKVLLTDGVILIDNVPPEPEGDAAQRLHEVINHCCGGLQKDPTRLPANWKIVHKPNAASISYDPVKQLYQHTDSSIPPHGIPGLLLSMHYVKGYGANTLTDGFAVAKALREENPEYFEILAKYGYDGERDFAASRMDSTQSIAKGLVINRRHPIFETSADGGLSRVVYNEVFRMPMSLPHDIFPRWYQAFSKFVSLLHSEKFQRVVPMKENTILIINNWRVLHGRAGNRASSDRHLVGGTIVREAIYSRAMQLARYIRENEED